MADRFPPPPMKATMVGFLPGTLRSGLCIGLCCALLSPKHRLCLPNSLSVPQELPPGHPAAIRPLRHAAAVKHTVLLPASVGGDGCS